MKSAATMTLHDGVQKQAKANTEKTKLLAVPRQVNDLEDLFANELNQIYWAEKALNLAILKIIRKTTAFELIKLLTGQLETKKEQFARLEQVFPLKKNEKQMTEKCAAIESLIANAEELMRKTTKGIARDAAIILVCQKIKHYEIATYGSLYSFAKTLGESRTAALLQATLNEEKDAVETLAKIADAFVNFEAASIYVN